MVSRQAAGVGQAARSQNAHLGAFLELPGGTRIPLLKMLSDIELDTTQSHTLAISWDESFIKFYIDGELVDVTADHRAHFEQAQKLLAHRAAPFSPVQVSDQQSVKGLQYFSAALSDSQVAAVSKSLAAPVASRSLQSAPIAPLAMMVETSGDVQLLEQEDFLSEYRYAVDITGGAQTLAIGYRDLIFDQTAQHQIKDAFEIALVDGEGNPLTDTIGAGRDAFFNWTEGQGPVWVDGVGHDPVEEVIGVDVSHLAQGQEAYVVVRLINNDSDTGTSVTIRTAQQTQHHVLWGIDEDDG